MNEYTVEDADGNPTEVMTTDPEVARKYAANIKGVAIELIYVFDDSEILEDYREQED